VEREAKKRKEKGGKTMEEGLGGLLGRALSLKVRNPKRKRIPRLPESLKDQSEKISGKVHEGGEKTP